mgnify:CR=1 FL=1
MYQQLRKIIDEQNTPKLAEFLNENPEINLNQVAPNGLSALWWALTPPQGKHPSKAVIELLIRTNRIDPHQNHGDMSLDEYCVFYPSIHQIITEYQNDYDPEPFNEMPLNNLNQFVNDGQNTHASFVMTAVDKAIAHFYTRYEKIMLSPQDTASVIEHWIKTTSIQTEATKTSARLAIQRIISDVGERTYELAEGTAVTLGNAQVLSLVWVALDDKDPASYVAHTGMTAEDINSRTERLIEHLAMTQNEYGNGHSACTIGTRNQIISCLDRIHVDVNIVNTNSLLTKEILVQQYQAFCADQLKQLEGTQPSLFQEYLSSYVLRGLPGGQSEEESPSLALLGWVENVHRNFKEFMVSSFTKIEFSLDEELVYLLNPSSEQYPALCHSLFPALEQLNFLASADYLAPLSTSLLSRSLDLTACIKDSQTLTEKIQHLQQYWLQQLDAERLTSWLAKNEFFKMYLAQCSAEEQSTFVNSYWHRLIEKTIHGIMKPSVSWLITYVYESTQTACPDLRPWLNHLKDEQRHTFFEQLIRQNLGSIKPETQDLLYAEALAFALSTGTIAYFPFQREITLTQGDFRGIDLKHIDLTKVRLQDCDLRLSRIHRNRTLDEKELENFLVEFSWLWLKRVQNDDLFSDETATSTWFLHAAGLINKNELEELFTKKAIADAFCQPKIQTELLFTILKNKHSEELFVHLINHPNFQPQALVQSVARDAYHNKWVVLSQNHESINQTTILFWITETYRLDLLKIIFEHPKINTNLLTTRDTDGNTLLHLINTEKEMHYLSLGYVRLIDLLNVRFKERREAMTHFFLTKLQGIESLYAIKNNFGESVLHKAVRVGNMILFHAILISEACDAALLALQDNNKQTIVHLAVQSEQPLFLQEILTSPHCHPALLEVRDMFGTNCLELALDKDYLDDFNIILQSPHLTQEMIIPQNPKHLNIVNQILYSGLSAVQKLNYIRSVLNCPHASALMQATVPGFSPLYIAVHEKEAEIVQLLLENAHCTTDLLKRQEVHDSKLTPLHASLMRNRGDSSIAEMLLQTPLCTMDVLKMKWWNGLTCLKSLQEHDDWELFRPYVEQKNKAFLENQTFMNIEAPTADGAFIETVNSLKNLMYTVFEPLDDLLIPAFQQATERYNRDQDIHAFLQRCAQALTAAELELKHNKNSLPHSSSASSGVEELMEDVDASKDSSASTYSLDSDSFNDSEEEDRDTIHALERITHIRTQLQTYEEESSLLLRIRTATVNYLNWTAIHAQGHRFVTRFSHFFHGSSGQARAQRVLNLINEGANYSALKPILAQVIQESGHRKHSYSRYLHAELHNLPQDDVLELCDQDFLQIKNNWI